MQTPPGRPHRVLSRHSSDRLPACHGLARCDESAYRLVLGANAVGMSNDDHAPSCHRAGEGDPPGTGREHLAAQRRAEIDEIGRAHV